MYVRKFRSDPEALREECRAVAGTGPEAAWSFRAAMVFLVLSGMSAAQLAECGVAAERTIMGWVASADAEGVGSLRDGVRTGRPPRLDEAQRERLAGVLAEGPAAHGYRAWTGRAVSELVLAEFGVSLGARSCTNLIRELGAGGGSAHGD